MKNEMIFEKSVLIVKVIGNKASQTYGNKELEKDFISNLKQFYERVLQYEKN
jgi:hypothetical protein